MRRITWALAALTTLAACSSEPLTVPTTAATHRPSFAVGSHCSNVKGTVAAYFVNDTDVEGTISGDVSGQALAKLQSFTWRKQQDVADVTMAHRYVMPDGEIFTSDVGVLRSIDEPIENYLNWFKFDNRLTIVGGTGAYAGASGSLRATGVVNPFIRPSNIDAPVGIQLSYSGRVCVPTTPSATVAP
jgi:hypothetical protein